MSPSSHRHPALCGAAALLLLACGSGASATLPSTAERVTAACIPSRSVSGGPINDTSGPYYHQAVIATTGDGLTMTGAHQVLDHASVPDGVRRADGFTYVYYVNGVDGAVWVARIEGDTARVLGPIAIGRRRVPRRRRGSGRHRAP